MHDILLIEDNPAVASALARALSVYADRHVTSVPSLEAACALLDEHPFDVAVFGIESPDSRGQDAFSTLRDHVDELPIIVLTNRPDRSFARELVLAGAADVICRNATDDTVVWAVEAAIARSEHHREHHETRSEVAVRDERRRIARDLHDRIVQRLYTTGLTLEHGARGTEDPDTADAFHEAQHEIDEVIQDFRRVIDHFHEPAATGSLTIDARRICEGVGRSSQRDITLVVDGDLDNVDPSLGQTLLSVLRESVVNAVRHGQGAIAVDLVADSALRLCVRSVSRPGAQSGPGVGLESMFHRATERDGTMDFSVNNGIANLEWHVPLHAGLVA